MKKLMVAVVSAASAIFAFGDLPHGADFEAEGFVVGESFTNYLDKGDGAVSEGTLYWEASIPGEEIGSIAAYTGTGRIGVDNVPDIYTNALTNAKYLQLDSGKNRLVRNIAEGGAAVPMSTGDGIYLDTLVKFSAASSLLDSDFDAGDKLAIAYVGELDDGNYHSNFVVRAGFIGESLPTNYLAHLPETTFDVEGWHRLTIRTLTNIDGNNRAGFKIYIDGTNLVYFTDNDNFAKSAGFGDDTHTIFPSAVTTGDYKETITAVAFAGNGGIDDVVFTTTKPNFIKATESVVATFTKDAGVTGISVQVGSGDPIVVDMNNLEATLPPGTDTFTVTATIADTYTFAAMSWGEDGLVLTNPGTITGYAGGEIAITTTRNNFSLFDANGDPIQGSFPTLGLALQESDVAKIQLAYDYTVDEDDIPDGYIEILESVTIDLNGKTLDGGESISNPLFMVTDGNFVIIDSVGGGKVVYDGPGIVYGATAYIGAVSGDLGPTFDGQLFYESGEGNVIRGQFDYAGNTASGAEPAFLWDAFLGDGDSVESECTGLVSGYWVVEPKGGSEPQVIAVPTAASNLVYDGTEQTGVAAGTGYVLSGTYAATAAGDYTAIATPASGYAWNGGSTEATNITWSIAKAEVTATVSLTVTEATYDSTKTTVTDYTTPSLTFGLGAPELVVNTDYTVGWNATEVSGAGTFTYTVSPVAGSNYTFTEASVTLTITAGSSYPSYIDDPTKQEKYDTWKSDMAAAGVDVGDGAAYEDAYLLNCKPAEVEAAKAAFKFTSISYDTTESKWVTTTTTGYNERTYNGTVTVTGYSDVGCTVQNAAGPFFKATLD